MLREGVDSDKWCVWHELSARGMDHWVEEKELFYIPDEHSERLGQIFSDPCYFEKKEEDMFKLTLITPELLGICFEEDDTVTEEEVYEEAKRQGLRLCPPQIPLGLCNHGLRSEGETYTFPFANYQNSSLDRIFLLETLSLYWDEDREKNCLTFLPDKDYGPRDTFVFRLPENW